LPQGWYFITIFPATEADLKADDEVNNYKPIQPGTVGDQR
jgi:hypothetical protein